MKSTQTNTYTLKHIHPLDIKTYTHKNTHTHKHNIKPTHTCKHKKNTKPPHTHKDIHTKTYK